MQQQQTQHILDMPKVIGGAIASPLAALATSRFGVTGTMIGLTLSAVIVTVIADTLKFYLARIPGAVTSIPGGYKKKSVWGRFLGRLRLSFSKLSSLPSTRRRSILIRSLIGGVIMFVIGLVVVTGVELSVGKNLSCWVWDDCYTESSAGGENASDASSLPSIFIASNSISSTSAPQVRSSGPQQQPSPLPPTPPSSPSSSGDGPLPSVSEQPSVPPSQQQSSPSSEYPQQSDYQPSDEYQQSLSGGSESQRQSPSSEPGSQQREGVQNESPNPPLSSEWDW